MKIRLPFKYRFKKPLHDDVKIWTARNKIYGTIGDTFDAFGKTFIIDLIFKMKLDDVADHYVEEGCSSRKEFIKVWKQIHPRKGFIPEHKVYVHAFHRVNS